MDKLELALWSLETAARDVALAMKARGGPEKLSPAELGEATRVLETTVRLIVPVIDQMRATVMAKLGAQQ